LLERDTLAVKHAVDVVVGNDEQASRVRKGLIFGEPTGISVAVRADERQVAYAAIKPPGDGASVRVSWEKPIIVEDRHEVASAETLLALQLLQYPAWSELKNIPSIDDAQVLKRYSQMKLQIKGEALEVPKRRASEKAPVPLTFCWRLQGAQSCCNNRVRAQLKAKLGDWG
jgi:hypothetical protein